MLHTSLLYQIIIIYQLLAISGSSPVVALGMESGDIIASQISSTTPYGDCSAEHSRLNYNDASTICHAFAPNTASDQGNTHSLLLTHNVS